ncbi:MAG: hypothetical protein ACLT9J_10655 [Agathobacter rectalis]
MEENDTKEQKSAYQRSIKCVRDCWTCGMSDDLDDEDWEEDEFPAVRREKTGGETRGPERKEKPEEKQRTEKKNRRETKAGEKEKPERKHTPEKKHIPREEEEEDDLEIIDLNDL